MYIHEAISLAVHESIADEQAKNAELLEALQRMCVMHEMMVKKTNFGASFYDAETITAMNEAPIQAALVIAKAEGQSS